MADSEKSLGDKLLGFFIKDEPSPSPAQARQPTSPVAGSAAAPNSPVSAPASSTGAVTGSVDTKFVDHFTAVLSKANLQGPDYFEFREILRNLSNLGLPEDKQFQAAWASFKAMATTGDPASLTQAANQYLTALSTDRDAFLKSVDAALQERVGGLETEQKKLQADNEAIAKQIAELQQRSQANTQRLASIGGEIVEQGAKLSQNRANFEMTYATFTDQIKADVSRINTYLK